MTFNRESTAPPEHSFVDGYGNRFIYLDIDIMVKKGDKFFATFRYMGRVHFDFSLGGWTVDCSDLYERLIEKYHSLENRKDVLICLNDAKVVKYKNRIHSYEENRKFHRSSSNFGKRCICIKG